MLVKLLLGILSLALLFVIVFRSMPKKPPQFLKEMEIILTQNIREFGFASLFTKRVNRLQHQLQPQFVQILIQERLLLQRAGSSLLPTGVII